MTAFQSRLALLFLTLFISREHTHAGSIHALDYQTPAYIDFELSEIISDAGATSAVVNIYRTGEFRQFTRLEYVTEEGTALEGSDYKGTGGTLTFAPAEGYKSIVIGLLPREGRTKCSFRLKLAATDPGTLLMRDSVEIVLQEEPPRLQITPGEGNTILVSWPECVDLVLERSSDPAGGAWETVLSEPEVTNGVCTVREPAGGTFYAYRLRSR